jgi:hypothetical protein
MSPDALEPIVTETLPVTLNPPLPPPPPTDWMVAPLL